MEINRFHRFDPSLDANVAGGFKYVSYNPKNSILRVGCGDFCVIFKREEVEKMIRLINYENSS